MRIDGTNKSGLLVTTAFCVACGLVWMCVPGSAWIGALQAPALELAARACAAVCFFILTWWGVHHLVFQMASILMTAPSSGKNFARKPVRFVVLHLVCDDFDKVAALSCLTQQGPSGLFKLVVCDDSETESVRAKVEAFCVEHAEVHLIRRPSRDGFKAGNVNHSLNTLAMQGDEWIVIADSDEVLAPDHLWELACFVDELPEATAFVQGISDRRMDGATPFQHLLSLEIPWCYRTSLHSRVRFGFLPFLGHAGAFRISAWRKLGGIPEVVSEDYAFAIEARRGGMTGRVWTHSSSLEMYPSNFRAFFRRQCKFSAGTAELVRTIFIRSRLDRPLALTIPERIDVLMQLGVYFLNLAALGNLFLTGWLASRRADEIPVVVSASLPYVFLGFAIVPFAMLSAGTRNPLEMLRYWAAANAVYLSLIPASVSAFIGALFRKPRFDSTGSTSMSETDGASHFLLALVATPLVGAITIFCAICWPSPFQWVMAGFGSAFLLFPAWPALHRRDMLGFLSRNLCLIPGACFLVALLNLWRKCWF